MPGVSGWRKAATPPYDGAMSAARCARLAILAIVLPLFAVTGSLEAQAHCPRPALARLSSMAGRWTVSWRTRVGDSLVTATEGRATIAWAAGQCALTEELSARLPTGPSAQHRLFVIVGDSLAMTYLDSEHGEPLSFVAVSGGSAGVVRLAWQRRMESGRVLRVRYTWQPGADADHFETRTELSTDNGVTWRVVQEARYARAA